MSGRIEVITGPMYSGKTEELIRRLRRHKIAGKNVITFKPTIDTRTEQGLIKGHGGSVVPCFSVDSLQIILDMVDVYHVVGIDEAQFFDFELTDICEQMRDDGKIVVVTGLDLTFRAKPWHNFHVLMAVCDKIDKLSAVCHVCGEDATLTQRLIDGKPAPFKDDTILVGGYQVYEARCREHFERGE